MIVGETMKIYLLYS